MTVRFGTDGLRGVAVAELTPELVLALGRATARVLAEPGQMVVVGRDTRISGPLLQAALTAGLASEGADVCDLGVLPTPGVAAVAAARGVPAAMISASHNPHGDNGIKLFAAGGRKLSDELEGRLEAELTAITTGLASSPTPGSSGAAPPVAALPVGRLSADPDASGWYVSHLLETLEGRRLSGVRVAVDCANGAASFSAVEALKGAGADVVAVLADQPNGVNINHGCGSTYPAALQSAVVANRADVGLAFDGDADRVIAVDETGALVDGDQLLALLGLDLRDRGRLTADTVVVTVMTNLGFRLAMDEHGIRVEETQVGDRYVLEALDQGKWSLGGEQSGHIIFRDLATTGDGILTGLQLIDVLRRTGRPLSHLAGQAMTRLPQVLRNVRVANRDGLAEAVAVWDEVTRVEKDLHGQGRVLLRPSGTEPLIRVMVEASSQAEAEAAAGQLVDVVSRTLG